jgi:uroporphyrinogen III methyltransferase/synthase
MATKTVKLAPGLVAFVAAGPGDPELLTLRAVDLMRSADVVIADPKVLATAATYAQAGAEVKAAVDEAGALLTAAARSRLVADASKLGKRVVRLLAGDPVLDGSLAAEVTPISKAGLPFEIAPGVSALTAAPAYAGFTLTGGAIRNVSVLDAEVVTDWATYGSDATALVILNSTNRLPLIAKELVDAGRAADTAVVVIHHGTSIEHEAVTTTLAEAAAAVRPPASWLEGMVFISTTVTQREAMTWFENRPLLGWKILVPRTRDDIGMVAETLRRLGASSVEVPTISVEPPRTPQQMERAIHGIEAGRYEWIAFTSPHAVRAVKEKFDEYGLDSRTFAGMKIAAIGTETTDALLAIGVRPDLVPAGEQTTASLLEEWPEFSTHEDPINRVFIPKADIATENLTEGLTARGWEVEDVTAYRTVRAAPPAAEIRDAIKSGGYDAVMFTSASTVRNLVGIAGKPHTSTVIACIGPATTEAAGGHGLRVDVQAAESNVPSLIATLADYVVSMRAQAQDPLWRPSRRKAGARRKTT